MSDYVSHILSYLALFMRSTDQSLDMFRQGWEAVSLRFKEEYGPKTINDYKNMLKKNWIPKLKRWVNFLGNKVNEHEHQVLSALYDEFIQAKGELYEMVFSDRPNNDSLLDAVYDYLEKKFTDGCSPVELKNAFKRLFISDIDYRYFDLFLSSKILSYLYLEQEQKNEQFVYLIVGNAHAENIEEILCSVGFTLEKKIDLFGHIEDLSMYANITFQPNDLDVLKAEALKMFPRYDEVSSTF